MPRRKRRRVGRKVSPAAACAAMAGYAHAMEEPLHRARGLVDALTFVGYGLESVEDDGARPVLTIATALADDMEALRANWLALLGAGGG